MEIISRQYKNRKLLMEAARRIYGAHVDIDEWKDLTMEQYALFGILVHPQTTTNRYAKVFDYCLKMRKSEALTMLQKKAVLPEISSLSRDEAAQITRIVNSEYDSMLGAMKNGLSYEDSFSQLFPYLSPFPSSLIWVKRKVNG